MYSEKCYSSVRLASTMDRSNQAKFPEEVGFGLGLEEQVKLRTTDRQVNARCFGLGEPYGD